MSLRDRYRIWQHNRSYKRRARLALIEVHDMIEEMRRHVRDTYQTSTISAPDYLLGVHMSCLCRWRSDLRKWFLG